METVMIADLKGMLKEAKMEIDLVLDAFDNKVVIGEISHPVEKKSKPKRTYRKRKDPAPFPDIVEKFEKKEDLPDRNKDHPFYSDKPKRGRKPKKDESTDQS